jgi:nucleoside-diphosphate-sugar epimerase
MPPALGKREPIHCDDVAINAIALLNRKESFGRTYNLSGKTPLTYQEIIRHISHVMKRKPRIFFCKHLPLLARILGPLSNIKTFNASAVKRANIDIVFEKDRLPDNLLIPPRSFLQHGAEDIFPMFR